MKELTLTDSIKLNPKFPILELNNISKKFTNGVKANDKISIKFLAGEIHCIVGENGSGKSTLVQIVAGNIKKDSGSILFSEDYLADINCDAPMEKSIGFIHQETSLIDELTILENVVVGYEEGYSGRFLGFLRPKKMLKKYYDICEKYNFKISPHRKIKTLSFYQKLQVEFIRSLWQDNKVLIFDEPTSILGFRERIKFFNLIKKLKSENKAIIIVSHKLQDVVDYSDKVTILRSGKSLGTFKTKEIDVDTLKKKMFGEIPIFKTPKRYVKETKKKVFYVENLSYHNELSQKTIDDVSFHVFKGEIFGLIGIPGNGAEDLMGILSGEQKQTSGIIKYQDPNFKQGEPESFSVNELDSHLNVSVIPFDLKKNASMPMKSIFSNATLTVINDAIFSKGFFEGGLKARHRIERSTKPNRLRVFKNTYNLWEFADDIVRDFSVQNAYDLDQPFRNLSFGNQQKLIVAREILRKHKLLIASSPIKGLDFKSANKVYEKLFRDSEINFTTVLIHSFDLQELVNICDRIAIFVYGKIIAIVDPKKKSFKEIANLMAGKNSKGGDINVKK